MDVFTLAEVEVTMLRMLFIKHFCTCQKRADDLAADHHLPVCGYRRVMAE